MTSLFPSFMPCRLQYCTCWASQERSGANERSLTAMGQAASPAAVSFAGNSRSLSHLEMNRAWINLASYLERTRRQVLCFCSAGSRRSWLCTGTDSPRSFATSAVRPLPLGLSSYRRQTGRPLQSGYSYRSWELLSAPKCISAADRPRIVTQHATPHR